MINIKQINNEGTNHIKIIFNDGEHMTISNNLYNDLQTLNKHLSKINICNLFDIDEDTYFDIFHKERVRLTAVTVGYLSVKPRLKTNNKKIDLYNRETMQLIYGQPIAHRTLIARLKNYKLKISDMNKIIKNLELHTNILSNKN